MVRAVVMTGLAAPKHLCEGGSRFAHSQGFAKGLRQRSSNSGRRSCGRSRPPGDEAVRPDEDDVGRQVVAGSQCAVWILEAANSYLIDDDARRLGGIAGRDRGMHPGLSVRATEDHKAAAEQ